MSRTSKTKYAVLGMLSTRPMCGYEITKTIAHSVAYFWSESHGQLYPTLAALKKEGLVTISKGTTKAPTGPKAAKTYRITKKGLTELKKWLEIPLEKEPPRRNELLLKLFFGQEMSKEACLQHIEQRKKWAQERLKEYNTKLNHIKLYDKDHPNRLYWQLTLEYGVNARQAELDWCLKARRLVDKTK